MIDRRNTGLRVGGQVYHPLKSNRQRIRFAGDSAAPAEPLARIKAAMSEALPRPMDDRLAKFYDDSVTGFQWMTNIGWAAEAEQKE